MAAIEHVQPSGRRPGKIAIAILGTAALVAVTVVALRHSPSPGRVVVLPQATTTVKCGDTITVSITVGNDLANCPSNGLNVGANGIIINLNGHTLTGQIGGYGVYNPTFSTVTIENGSVKGWSFGVYDVGPTNKVTGVRASQNDSGMFVVGTGSTVSADVSFSNTQYGIYVGNAGITGIKVTSNVVRQNGTQGIFVNGTGTVVQTNQAENNTSNGIYDQGTGNTMTGNITNGNGSDGINSAGDATAAVGTNTANYNSAYGIEAAAGGKDSGGNLAKGNGAAAQCKDVVCS